MTETADIHNTESPEQKAPTLSSSQLLSLDIPANFKTKAGTVGTYITVLCVLWLLNLYLFRIKYKDAQI